MVLCEEGDAVVAVGQPSHAWVSGQLARAWGNERFAAAEPWEEVCLGAEQHDVGMTWWDLEPELNLDTGRPQAFTEMALETHLELWSRAPDRIRAQSRYAALLVLMHGMALYERRDLDRLEPGRADAVRTFLERGRARRAALLDELRADAATAQHAAPEIVARNSRLVWTWDSLSLALLLGWAPHELTEVPTADGPATLSLEAHGEGRRRHVLAPWPFAADRVEVRCEGRRLEGRYDDEEEMRAALGRAPWVTLAYELIPGECEPELGA